MRTRQCRLSLARKMIEQMLVQHSNNKTAKQFDILPFHNVYTAGQN